MTISQSPKPNVLGKVAIWTGIVAAVLSLVLGVTIRETTPHQQHPEFLWRFREWPYALCGIVFLILASVAFACGRKARGTAAGKAGVGLAVFGCAHLAFLSASVGVPFLLLMMISGRWLLGGKPEHKAGSPAQADARIERADGQQSGITGELAQRWVDHQGRAEEG